MRVTLEQDVIVPPFEPTTVNLGFRADAGLRVTPVQGLLASKRLTVESSVTRSDEPVVITLLFIPSMIRDQQGHLIAQEAPCLLKAGDVICELV